MRLVKFFVPILIATFAIPAFADPPPEETYDGWHEQCKARLIMAGARKTKHVFSNDKPFICRFKISDKGVPENLSIVLSTDDHDADAEALEVVKRSAPFPQCCVPSVKILGVRFGDTITVHHSYGNPRPGRDANKWKDLP